MMHDQEILCVLDDIEKTMLDEATLGFSPTVLSILDNVEASEREIEMIKGRIGHDILMRIFNFANCAYYGSLNKGSIHTFYEIVTRLGMSHTKALIIILSLQHLAQDDEYVQILFARSFASSVIGKIMAQQIGMRDDVAKKVELGALFSEIGRMIFFVYKKLHAPDNENLDEHFVETYHPYLTERIILSYALPDYLRKMIFSEGLVVEADYITLSGITQLATHFVYASFLKYHNRLVIEPIALPSGHDAKISLEQIIADQFHAVGLERYLRIVRKKTRVLPLPEE